MADATTNTLPIVYAHVTFLSYFLSTQSTEVSNHHHSLETIKNDLSNTQQLLDTYKQQSESLTERLRQEQTRHREVTLLILNSIWVHITKEDKFNAALYNILYNISYYVLYSRCYNMFCSIDS